MNVNVDTQLATEVLEAGWGIGDARVEPVAIGLINRTFLVHGSGGERFILQYVNPIFTPRVHDDIDAVTAHVAAKHDSGLVMPRLVKTSAGGLYTEHGGQVFRMLTFLEGDTFERLSSASQAREAGRLLARFHRAVSDLSHEFKNRRLGVHDTPKHLATLQQALLEKGAHARYEVVRPLGEEILALAAALPALPPVADRVVHGDPKISNLLFEPKSGRAIALVDLDTLARMPVFLELGDAFRSWCNPKGENETEVLFSLELFEAAVGGYAEVARTFLSGDEQRAIVAGTLTIIVELSSRFCADALNESYFGWDPKRFATRGEHNELRARGQLALARSLLSVYPEAEAVVTRAFS